MHSRRLAGYFLCILGRLVVGGGVEKGGGVNFVQESRCYVSIGMLMMTMMVSIRIQE